MPYIVAYFLTWTTYGTWLPGDVRGWVKRRRGGDDFIERPIPALETHARRLMKESPALLDARMRSAVDAAVRRCCGKRGWTVRALAVRSNHVHLVVTVPDASPGKAMGILKVEATRALNGLTGAVARKRWWTRDGSKRLLDSEESVAAAVRYVMRHKSPKP
jgi:REP element-mobilizing transposase RayT